MVNRERMEAQLILHEGLRLRAYRDTLDNWTVGVGYNLTGRGVTALEQTLERRVGPIEKVKLTRDEAVRMLRVDLERVEKAVRVYFPEYDALNEARQRVCVDMAFNMGFKALGFKQCITAIKASDWSTAARELFKSRWAGQVGDGPGKHYDRADRLSTMLLTGHDYTR
jgi:lysozyme